MVNLFNLRERDGRLCKRRPSGHHHRAISPAVSKSKYWKRKLFMWLLKVQCSSILVCMKIPLSLYNVRVLGNLLFLFKKFSGFNFFFFEFFKFFKFFFQKKNIIFNSLSSVVLNCFFFLNCSSNCSNQFCVFFSLCTTKSSDPKFSD